ncbi:hypothetical protein BDR26DRAFT_876931 [Obelidium mucronatum]|nr:hypothetical protein BDR26DRAFT_876931 [Obelidium mucronatum]
MSETPQKRVSGAIPPANGANHRASLASASSNAPQPGFSPGTRRTSVAPAAGRAASRTLSILPPSKIDRRASANRPRRITSYNAITLPIRNRTSMNPSSRSGTPELPTIATLPHQPPPPKPTRQSILSTPIPKELLEQADAYESLAMDARISFSIFKESMLIEIDKKLFSDRPYMVAGGPYAMRTSRFRRGTSGGDRGGGVGGAYRVPESGMSRAGKNTTTTTTTIKTISRHSRRGKKKDQMSSAESSDTASSLPRIKKNNFVVAADTATNDSTEGKTNFQSRLDKNDGSGVGDEEEEGDDEFDDSDVGSSDSFLLEAVDIEVAEKGIPEILLAIDLEQENQRIQNELSHTREASALSQVQNAAYLESNLTNLVANAEEYSLTSQLASQQMELHAQTAQHLMDEAKRGEQMTDKLLKLVEGEIYDDMWQNLDTVVQRTMPNVKLRDYAFHEELATLADLRGREHDLEVKFSQTKTNLRIAESDLRLVEDELELMVINVQKIEQKITDILAEITNTTNQITTNHSLHVPLQQQIHNFVTYSLLPYCEATTVSLQSHHHHHHHHSTNTTANYRPSSAAQQAQLDSLNTVSTLKICGTNLINASKQTPATVFGSLHSVAGAGAAASVTHGGGGNNALPHALGNNALPPSSASVHDSSFSLTGGNGKKHIVSATTGTGGGGGGASVSGGGVPPRTSTTHRGSVLRASIVKRMGAFGALVGRTDLEPAKEGSEESSSRPPTTTTTGFEGVVQKAIQQARQSRPSSVASTGGDKEMIMSDNNHHHHHHPDLLPLEKVENRRKSMLLRRPSLKIAASLVAEDWRRPHDREH